MCKSRLAQALCGVLLLNAVVSFSLAGTIRHDRSDQLYLNLGAQPAYASVGQLKFSTPNGNYLGSGTLIASNWVLTAAHCVDTATTMQFNVGGGTYSGGRWFAYPQWNGNLAAGYDIGLIQLTAPVSAITPATRYRGQSEIGRTATFVGYGMTGTGLTGAIKYDGKKRGGQNVLDRFYSGSNKTGRILMADFDNPLNKKDNRYGSATPLNLEYLIAPGDSGGGVFVDFGSGPVLVGVNSFGGAYDGKVDSDYGDVSGSTRVSAFNAWIDSFVGYSTLAGKTSANGTDSLPAKLSAVPEPASMSLLVLGVLAFLRRRRS